LRSNWTYLSIFQANKRNSIFHIAAQLSAQLSNNKAVRPNRNIYMIGERIKQIRGKEPQEEFAKRFGVSRSTILRYESDERKPDTDFIAALCKAYNVNANWLLTGEEQKIQGAESLAYPATTFTLGEHVDLLAKIHNSGNTVLIKAIDANLHAFTEAIDNKALAQRAIDMMDEMNKRVLTLENKLAHLEKENEELKRKPPDSKQQAMG
jgi:transcriptional regulator with XRE-family HTH domain